MTRPWWDEPGWAIAKPSRILVERRADRMLRTARAILRNDAEAHDAAQQALVSAWVHLPKLRDPDRFDVWLNRTLINACRETLRRRGRSREVDLDGSSVAHADHAGGSLETMSIRAAFARLRLTSATSCCCTTSTGCRWPRWRANSTLR